MATAGEPRWLDESQQRSWRALMMGITLLLDRLDADLRRSFDISLAEYEILVRLSERPQRQLRMAQLADAMAHSRSRVTHTVKRMEHAGLVLRTTSAEDGRGVVCAMTDAGYEKLASMAPVARERGARLLGRHRQPRGLRGPRTGDERGRRQARRHPSGERDPLSDAEVCAAAAATAPIVRALVVAVARRGDLGVVADGVAGSRSPAAQSPRAATVASRALPSGPPPWVRYPSRLEGRWVADGRSGHVFLVIHNAYAGPVARRRAAAGRTDDPPVHHRRRQPGQRRYSPGTPARWRRTAGRRPEDG